MCATALRASVNREHLVPSELRSAQPNAEYNEFERTTAVFRVSHLSMGKRLTEEPMCWRKKLVIESNIYAIHVWEALM